MMFNECTDPIFDFQTLNPKPEFLDPINAFKCHFVGWNVLEDGEHLFWVLIGHFSSPYASICWHVGNISLRKVFQVVKSACKTNDAYLYAKCHPT
jgi:hypothetical protein